MGRRSGTALAHATLVASLWQSKACEITPMYDLDPFTDSGFRESEHVIHTPQRGNVLYVPKPSTLKP